MNNANGGKNESIKDWPSRFTLLSCFIKRKPQSSKAYGVVSKTAIHSTINVVTKK